jgi:hypothetical protein
VRSRHGGHGGARGSASRERHSLHI